MAGSSEFPLAYATVIAALITAVVSFVNLIISKEQKVSEFRQTWIDALREDLAEFSAQARLIAINSETTEFDVKSKPLLPLLYESREPQIVDALLENRQRLAQKYYTIKLRLNPKETDHQALSKLLDDIYGILNTSGPLKRYLEATSSLEDVSSSAQEILKKEWRRVKRGERMYIFAMRGALVIVSVCLATLVIYTLCVR